MVAMIGLVGYLFLCGFTNFDLRSTINFRSEFVATGNLHKGHWKVCVNCEFVLAWGQHLGDSEKIF